MLESMWPKALREEDNEHLSKVTITICGTVFERTFGVLWKFSLKQLTRWGSLWQCRQRFLWFEERTEPSCCCPPAWNDKGWLMIGGGGGGTTMPPPIHRLVGGLGQKRVAGLHLPAANVLLAAAVSLISLSRVSLCFEFHVLENKLATLKVAPSPNYCSLTCILKLKG